MNKESKKYKSVSTQTISNWLETGWSQGLLRTSPKRSELVLCLDTCLAESCSSPSSPLESPGHLVAVSWTPDRMRTECGQNAKGSQLSFNGMFS